MNERISPNCCHDAIGFLEWREASALSGPEKPAWSIGFDSPIYGDASYVGISFCPFCGTKLEAIELTNEQAASMEAKQETWRDREEML